MFQEICFKYGGNGWNYIESALLERYAICLRQLKQTDCLVKCYLHLVRFPKYLELETHHFYLEQLKSYCLNASVPITTVDSPLFHFHSGFFRDDLQPDAVTELVAHLQNTLPTVGGLCSSIRTLNSTPLLFILSDQKVLELFLKRRV